MLFLARTSDSQDKAATGTPVTVTVTATSHGNTSPSAVPENEVVVKQHDDVRRIVSWTPIQQGQSNLEIVVMVDDSLSTRIASQFDDLRNFVTTLPPDARVAVVYAQNGSAHFVQEFTTDHAQAAKAFHVPEAIPGSAVGIYDATRDLFKHWTPSEGSRHVLVVLSSGVDLSEGYQDTNPALNMPLQQAVSAAQRAQVVVYTIYATDPGRAMRGDWLNLNGQGSLAELASETGGEDFYEGFGNPVSLQPFLENIHRLLGQQYLLTFLAQAGPKGDFVSLRVTSEQNGIKLHAPQHVYVPAAQ
jgi:VWFA-related protein